MSATKENYTTERFSSLWHSVGGGDRISSVETLQIEKLRSVFRLHFANGHPPVIAKHCPAADAEREHLAYHDVLPSFGIIGPKSYGLIHDDNNSNKRRSWLFIEHIGGRLYDASDKEHQLLAGKWLAKLHTAGSRHPNVFNINNRSSEHYGTFVDTCIQILSHQCQNDDLTNQERALLKRIHDFCITLKGHWPDIEAFCKSMPQTLMHGDFKEDNMRVVDTDRGPEIIAFDWANSGWGAPGLDIAKFTGYSVSPALQPYLRMCLQHWPTIDKAAIVRMGYVGEIFRWSETIRWHADELNYGRKLSVMASMPVYAVWMEEINRMAPWKETDLVMSGRWRPVKKHWR